MRKFREYNTKIVFSHLWTSCMKIKQTPHTHTHTHTLLKKETSHESNLFRIIKHRKQKQTFLMFVCSIFFFFLVTLFLSLFIIFYSYRQIDRSIDWLSLLFDQDGTVVLDDMMVDMALNMIFSTGFKNIVFF